MRSIITAALTVATLSAAAGAVYAHHEPSTLGTVQITQPVMAGGTRLEPGTYEIRLTGEHLTPLPGQSEEAVQRIEFVRNGMVAARDAAEVIPAEGGPVGTSGGEATRPRVQMLKGGDFLRVSTTRGGERYLIHLAVAH
jgi:hypothetical protein